MPLLRGIKLGKFDGQYLGLYKIGKNRPKRIWYWLLPMKYRLEQLVILAKSAAKDPFSETMAIKFLDHVKNSKQEADDNAAGDNNGKLESD